VVEFRGTEDEVAMVKVRLSEEEFDAVVRRGIERLPQEIRRHLDNMIIAVRTRPSRSMLEEVGLTEGDALLGLFRGVPLVHRSVTSPPLYPDTIYLFQEPLEEVSKTIEELEEQIEVTLVHEVAHFVGMTEERLAELGYG
jgi:predicted Zn-dependent protease with MMP-like domain